MTDLDFMGYKRVILKSDQEPSIALWHGEIVPEASPKGESKSNGEVERHLYENLKIRKKYTFLSDFSFFKYIFVTEKLHLARKAKCLFYSPEVKFQVGAALR